MDQALPSEFNLVRRCECAPYDRVVVIERNLTGGDTAELRCNSVINFVADHQESELPVLRGWAEIDWFQENLIEVLSAKPPAALPRPVGRSTERCLRHFAGKTRRCRMQSNHGPSPVCQHEQIAASQSPQ